MEATRIQEIRRDQANSRRIQTWSLRGPIAALAGIVGGAGVWITRGHIEEFEQQLRALGRR